MGSFSLTAISGSRLTLPASAALVLWILPAVPVTGEPTWWKDNTAVPNLVKQTGKSVVVYFESPKAAECKRMDEETWPFITAEEADANFVWMRVNPEEHQTFFTHYEIQQVPAVVILDSDLAERFRVDGFIAAWELLERLKEVPRGVPSVQTTSDGRVITLSEASRARAHRKAIEDEKPFFYESFDDFRDLALLRSRGFSAVRRAESRLDGKTGVYASPCLIVDSGKEGSAAIRLEIPGLEKREQIEGRLRVRARMKAIQMPEELASVAAVSIVRSDDQSGQAQSKRFNLTLYSRHSQWTDREVITEPFNFRTNKVFITFAVNAAGLSFGVEDIRVDLLPAADTGSVALASASAPDPAKLMAPPQEHPLFRQFDKDQDSRLTKSEVTQNLYAAFDLMDENGDGFLTPTEAERNFNEAIRGRKSLKPAATP